MRKRVEEGDYIFSLYYHKIEERTNYGHDIFLDLVQSKVKSVYFELPSYGGIKPVERMRLHKKNDQLVGQIIYESHQGLMLIVYTDVVHI